MAVKMLLQPFICIIYAKLFKAIPLQKYGIYHEFTLQNWKTKPLHVRGTMPQKIQNHRYLECW